MRVRILRKSEAVSVYYIHQLDFFPSCGVGCVSLFTNNISGVLLQTVPQLPTTHAIKVVTHPAVIMAIVPSHLRLWDAAIMGIGKLKMAVHIPCLNVLVTAIMIMIVQVTLFVINVMSMSPSLDAVEENKMIQRQITASVQVEVMVASEMLEMTVPRIIPMLKQCIHAITRTNSLV